MAILILVIVLIVMILMAIFLIPGITGAPYVRTDQQKLKKSLKKLYNFKKGDLLIDLGAGDGAVLETVSRYGISATGVDINPILVLITKWRLRKNKLIKMHWNTFRRYRFPENTTVVYTYILQNWMLTIYRKVQREATRLGRPLYLISNAFDLPDVKPVRHIECFYLYKIEPEKL